MVTAGPVIPSHPGPTPGVHRLGGARTAHMALSLAAAPDNGAEGHCDTSLQWGGSESSQVVAAAADLSTVLGACLVAPCCPRATSLNSSPRNSCSHQGHLRSADGPAGVARVLCIPPEGCPAPQTLQGRTAKREARKSPSLSPPPPGSTSLQTNLFSLGSMSSSVKWEPQPQHGNLNYGTPTS